MNKGPATTLKGQPAPGSAPTAQPAAAVTASNVAGLVPVVRKEVGPPLAALEKVRRRTVIAYFLEERAALADEQMLHLYEHLRRIGKQKALDLFISTRGGATEVPLRIVRLFREFADTFSVLVPYRAHSAGTHIALGADEIVMTEMSELGPVDPTRRHPLLPKEELPNGEKEPIPISVQDLRQLLQFLKREMGEDLTSDAAAHVYTALFEQVHPLAIGAMEQTWALAQQISEQVLATHMNPTREGAEIRRIVDKLSDYYKSHLYQITRTEAREIGLKVKDASKDESDAMWELYTAYTRLQVGGTAQQGSITLELARLGHIDSTAGNTLGLELLEAGTPPKSRGSRWESSWSPLATQATPAVAPQAAQPAAPVAPPVSKAP